MSNLELLAVWPDWSAQVWCSLSLVTIIGEPLYHAAILLGFALMEQQIVAKCPSGQIFAQAVDYSMQVAAL